MARYKITLDREGCIGCGACTSVAPDFFEMGDDGKSQLKGKKKDELDLDNYDNILDAANTCPVNVIHVFDNEKKERLK